MERMSVSDLNKMILSHFAENWDYCSIIWDLHNAHVDIDEEIKNSPIKLIASPFIEFVNIQPVEIPVHLAMRKAALVLNILLAEPEGQGNKLTLDGIDLFSTIYSSQSIVLRKPSTTDSVILDFGEVEMGPSELFVGKFISQMTVNGRTFF